MRGDAPFDNAAYLDMLVDHGHNFTRLWQWLHPVATPWTTDEVRIAPLPYARTGPGLAADGEPRFDLTVLERGLFRPPAPAGYCGGRARHLCLGDVL